MVNKVGYNNLQKDVVDTGLCTGCGTCVGVCMFNAISMDYEADEPVPVLTGNCTNCSMCYEVCPGKNIPLPEMTNSSREKNVILKMIISVYKYYW